MLRSKGLRAATAGALVVAAGAVMGLILIGGCEHSDSHHGSNSVAPTTSRSYNGHPSRVDMTNFVQANPSVYGTRLDDCVTCHWGQTVKDNTGASIKPNPCNYCHYIQHPPTGWTNLPTNTSQTLNPYGAAYLAAGRDRDAVGKIRCDDSDGDGYLNWDEIAEGSFPGDPKSYPGEALCPTKTVTLAELEAMPQHTQFGLANAERQQYDFYATYTGVKIKDILAAKGIPTATASSIDIISPDGFVQSFTMDEVNNQFPAHQFFSGLGLGTPPGGYDATCAFVQYPANTYSYGNGAFITDQQWHIIAYLREGLPLDPSYLDPTTGKINGEGPFRNVIPPNKADPTLMQPDRGSKVPVGCPDSQWNYKSAKDHNAGRMAKGAIIIRISPMPTNCEQFDYMSGGFALIDSESMLIYGNSVE